MFVVPVGSLVGQAAKKMYNISTEHVSKSQIVHRLRSAALQATACQRVTQAMYIKLRCTAGEAGDKHLSVYGPKRYREIIPGIKSTVDTRLDTDLLLTHVKLPVQIAGKVSCADSSEEEQSVQTVAS